MTRKKVNSDIVETEMLRMLHEAKIRPILTAVNNPFKGIYCVYSMFWLPNFRKQKNERIK